MRLLALIAVLLIGTVNISAQHPSRTFEFDSTVYDFGTIEEKDGPVSHVFRFRNVSDRPLSIESVLSTCGCMIPQYDREPVMPGGSGSITVQFDPKGMTASFHKSVRIVTDGGQSVISLFLKGNVILDETPEEGMYEIAEGIYVASFILSLGTLQHGTASAYHEIPVYNARKEAVRIDCTIDDQSGCLHVGCPDMIPACTTEEIRIFVTDVPDWYGSLKSRVLITANGAPAYRTIEVFGWLVDDLRGIRIDSSPICGLLGAYWNFGRVPRGTALHKEFTVTNEGKSPLIIRKVETSGPVSAEYVPNLKLSPGESARIRLTADSSQQGPVDSNVTIISNDAISPVKRFKVEGDIY